MEYIQPKLLNFVYLCGPLEGNTVEEMFEWRDLAQKRLWDDGYIHCYIPGEDTSKNDARTIVDMDFMEISNSEALLVCLDFLSTDNTASGTLIEIGYAYRAGKLIVGFTRTEWKKEHRFLRGSINQLFSGKDSLEEAIQYLSMLNKRKRITLED